MTIIDWLEKFKVNHPGHEVIGASLKNIDIWPRSEYDKAAQILGLLPRIDDIVIPSAVAVGLGKWHHVLYVPVSPMKGELLGAKWQLRVTTFKH